jgi:hypothetical protein
MVHGATTRDAAHDDPVWWSGSRALEIANSRGRAAPTVESQNRAVYLSDAIQ